MTEAQLTRATCPGTWAVAGTYDERTGTAQCPACGHRLAARQWEVLEPTVVWHYTDGSLYDKHR